MYSYSHYFVEENPSTSATAKEGCCDCNEKRQDLLEKTCNLGKQRFGELEMFRGTGN
jgi:hypothetical protein